MTTLSNYPTGFEGGVAIKGIPVLNTYAGKVFWVSSTRGSDGNKGTQRRPFATLAYALTQATANNGDIIMVMPLHAETIAGAAGIAQSTAGVSVLGLGTAKQRPRFLFGAAASTYAITANDAYLENMVFAGNFSNVVAAITTTKKGTFINRCDFENNGTNLDLLTPIKATSTTDNDSDDLRVENCRWITSDTDDLEFIEINATIKGFRCNNNCMVSAGTASPLILVATGKLLTGAEIGWNRVVNAMTANELFISNDGTTNTGVIHNNYVGHADVTGTHDPGWDAGGFRLFNNLSTSVDNLQGVVVPAIDVNL